MGQRRNKKKNVKYIKTNNKKMETQYVLPNSWDAMKAVLIEINALGKTKISNKQPDFMP